LHCPSYKKYIEVLGHVPRGEPREQMLWGAAEGTGIVQRGKKRRRGVLIALYNCLNGGCVEMGIGLFSQTTTAWVL